MYRSCHADGSTYRPVRRSKLLLEQISSVVHTEWSGVTAARRLVQSPTRWRLGGASAANRSSLSSTTGYTSIPCVSVTVL
jgi:hypothetical protein